MSVRKRTWKSPTGSRRRHGSSTTSTSTATATSRRSPRSATPTPITPSSAPPSAPACIPPTARASPSPRPPSLARELRSRRAGAHDDHRLPAACRAAHRARARRAEALAAHRAPGARLRGSAAPGRALPGHGAQGPPLARRASSPTRRSAASWRRTSSTRCASGAAARTGAPSGNGKLKIGDRHPDARRDARHRRTRHLDGRWRPLLLTAIFTGLRASELRGLRWSDVDLKRGELHVRQRADRYGEIGRPKSEAGERTVPLPPMVVTALREHRSPVRRRAGSRLPQQPRRHRAPQHHRRARLSSGADRGRRGRSATARRNTRACTRCATSTPRGASTGASTAGSNCRSRWCRRGSAMPRSR